MRNATGILILSLCLSEPNSFANTDASGVVTPRAVQPSAEVLKAIEVSLEQFRLGSELPDPELRAIGLRNSVRLLVEMRRAGVALKFDPLQYKDEQIAIKLKEFTRNERTAGLNTRAKSVLHVCFMAASIACGYNFENPTASTITGVSEIDQPGHVIMLPVFEGPPTGQ